MAPKARGGEAKAPATHGTIPPVLSDLRPGQGHVGGGVVSRKVSSGASADMAGAMKRMLRRRK